MIKHTWGTVLVIFMCWWGFIVELLGSVSLSPDIHVMVSLGGLVKDLVEPPHNEWQRYITHLFLHGSFLHIIFNSIALYFGGRFLELIAGHTWFFLVLFLSGFGGGWLGMVLSDPHTVLIGISGGVMGILGALILMALSLDKKIPLRRHVRSPSKVASGREVVGDLGAEDRNVRGVHEDPSTKSTHQFSAEVEFQKRSIMANSMQIIIPSLVPVLSGVSYAAHLGGLIIGVACGGVWIIWNKVRYLFGSYAK